MRMHDSKGEVLHWLHVDSSVSAIIRDCHFFAHNHTHGKSQRPINLFFLEDAPDYIGMGMPGPLSNTTQGNQFVVFMTHRLT